MKRKKLRQAGAPLSIEEISVGEWAPDDKRQSPQVHLTIVAKRGVSWVMRFKTPQGIDPIISALVRYRQSIWGNYSADFITSLQEHADGNGN